MEQLNLLVSTLNLSNSAIKCESELGGLNRGERIKTMPQKANRDLITLMATANDKEECSEETLGLWTRIQK
jgi:hypothetical protein